jgi:hypothetical protein
MAAGLAESLAYVPGPDIILCTRRGFGSILKKECI